MIKLFHRYRQNRFCLTPSASPTYSNLSRYLQEQGWRPSRFNWQASFNESHFQFDSNAANQLEFKHLLAQLVTPYCPQIMPITYCINDQNWPVVLSQIVKTYSMQNHYVMDQRENLVWILKPALLNNGKDIKIFQQLSQIEHHFLNPNRLGGEHVLQQYLLSPHLLRGPPNGHKYSIRMFIVMTNYAGAYLYPRGYFNVALHPYAPREFADLRPHLTNEHLLENESNVIQIPSQRFEFFDALYPQIKTIVTSIVNSLQHMHPNAFVCKAHRTVALFGFDFMVDKDKTVWLLEVNHGPCFPMSDEHPLQKHLYYDFWQAFIKSFVIPIAKQCPSKTIQVHRFEPIKKNPLNFSKNQHHTLN